MTPQEKMKVRKRQASRQRVALRGLLRELPAPLRAARRRTGRRVLTGPGDPGAPLEAASVLSRQVPSFSSSEDEGPPSVPRWPSSGPVPKHSTPKEGPLPWRRRPLGHVPHRWGGGPAEGSPLPSRSSRVLSSPLRKRRLSTIWASEESSGQLGPDLDPQAPEEEPPVPVSATWQQQQRQEASPGSWPGNGGLPGIQNTAGRRPRKRKKLAAVVGTHPGRWPVTAGSRVSALPSPKA